MELNSLAAKEVLKLYKEKKLSVEQYITSTYVNIQELDLQFNACIYLTPFADIVNAITESQRRIDNGSMRGLEGLVIVIKDNIVEKGRRASAGSRVLANYTGSYDATVVERIREAGGIIIARSNMDAFAMGSATSTSYYGSSKHPIDIELSPGGSSGGTAAMVKSFQIPLGLGSDTGGSIRQPASWCGLVGLKPTYGSISRYGLIAYASSLDQIGPMARTVDDCKLFFDAIKGRDDRDETSVEYREVKVEVKKLAYIKEEVEAIEDSIIKDTVLEVIEKLKRDGYIVEELSLKVLELAMSSYITIASIEAASNLARYDGIRYGEKGRDFEYEVKKRILLGRYLAQGDYYQRASLIREKLIEDYRKIFDEYDIILGPTTATLAKNIKDIGEYEGDKFTVIANLTKLPAITIPIKSKSRLPIGLQLMANSYEEGKLFDLARRVEELTNE